jgi:hypothetical protein
LLGQKLLGAIKVSVDFAGVALAGLAGETCGVSDWIPKLELAMRLNRGT